MLKSAFFLLGFWTALAGSTTLIFDCTGCLHPKFHSFQLQRCSHQTLSKTTPNQIIHSPYRWVHPMQNQQDYHQRRPAPKMEEKVTAIISRPAELQEKLSILIYPNWSSTKPLSDRYRQGLNILHSSLKASHPCLLSSLTLKKSQNHPSRQSRSVKSDESLSYSEPDSDSSRSSNWKGHRSKDDRPKVLRTVKNRFRNALDLHYYHIADEAWKYDDGVAKTVPK